MSFRLIAHVEWNDLLKALERVLEEYDKKLDDNPAANRGLMTLEDTPAIANAREVLRRNRLRPANGYAGRSGKVTATRLRTERVRQGLTQARLAALADVHTSAISRIESRTQVPSRQDRERLSLALGLTQEAVFGDFPHRIPLESMVARVD